jgi:hypothetical protein
MHPHRKPSKEIAENLLHIKDDGKIIFKDEVDRL